MYDYEEKINNAVFPSLQGGPHNNAIAGIATAMLQAKSSEFQEYQQRVVLNAKRLASELEKLGFYVVTGGTDNHLVLVDLVKTFKVTGSKAEHVLELVDIACNKNTGTFRSSKLSIIRVITKYDLRCQRLSQL